MPLPQVSNLLFIKIHGLTRFTTIYSFNNNDNNDPPCVTFQAANETTAAWHCSQGGGVLLNHPGSRPLAGEPRQTVAGTLPGQSPTAEQFTEKVGLTPLLPYIPWTRVFCLV